MTTSSMINFNLIKRYDKSGPRYTSYPTAVMFHDQFKANNYIQIAKQSNQNLSPLSLYFHIPFCDTVCFYCACNKIVTKDYSKADKYLDYLYREIEMQSVLYSSKRVVKQLHFGGGTPTFLSSKQIQQLMLKIGQHFNLAPTKQAEFSIEIDPRSVDSEKINQLCQMGFNRFSLGVQDINLDVQKAVNRVQSLEETNEIVTACRRNQVKSISIDLIYGLPLQTTESFNQTLKQVIKTLSPDRLSIFNYAHLPTLFKPQRRINEDDLPSAAEKLKILAQSMQQLHQAGYVYIGMDHFAKPDDELALAQKNGQLHRNFQGYTTHAACDLIAMGVSAISSVHHSYSQNSKDINDYYEQLDHQQLPIIKGLVLTADDVMRRQIIQQLSCHFKLNFLKIENDYQIVFKTVFKKELAALQPMIEDRLVSIHEQQLIVSDMGRFLIRNICMIFDKYLENKESINKFSKLI